MTEKTILKKLRREQFKHKLAKRNVQNPVLSTEYNRRIAKAALREVNYLQGLLRHSTNPQGV